MVMDAEPSLPRLGIDRELVHIERLDGLRQVTLALARQANRSVDLLSHDLEPRLYDDTDFLAALRQLATGRRNAQIRILARELDAATKTGHRLFALARRLTSFIEIRCLGGDDLDFEEALMIVDRVGMITRSSAARFEAEASFHAPRRAEELAKLFDALWARAVSESNARRLYL